MGFLDFLSGGSGREYARLLAWSEKKIGKANPGMTNMQIESYVLSLRSSGPKIPQSTLDGFKTYLKRKYGQKDQ